MNMSKTKDAKIRNLSKKTSKFKNGIIYQWNHHHFFPKQP